GAGDRGAAERPRRGERGGAVRCRRGARRHAGRAHVRGAALRRSGIDVSAVLESLLAEGVEDGAWTEAELAVARDGATILRAKVGRARVFDVASVTKVATAALALKLLDPERPVRWVPGAPTVRALLAHAAGL